MSFNISKDPQADLDYSIDWTAWLGSDTISTSTWTAPAASGITTHSASINGLNTKTTVWLSGGVAGGPYLVVNHVVTAGGRTDDRSLLVFIQQK